MRFLRFKPHRLLAGTLAAFLLAVIVAGCVISPRRTFTGTPAPTPTPSPGTTPTPTPVSGTPTPTPTPTASKEVPRGNPQFIFVGDPSSPLISGFRVNPDGSLMPVTGSPFPTSAAVQAETSLPGTLIVATQAAISVFMVDKEAGFIRQTDSIKAGGVKSLRTDSSAGAVFAITQQGTLAFQVSNGKLSPLPTEVAASLSVPKQDSSMTTATLDASGQFMYVMDQSKAEIEAFRIDQGKPQPLTPSSYPASRGANLLTLVTTP